MFLPSQGQGRGSDRVLCSSGQLLGVHSFAEINLQMLLAQGSNVVTAFCKTKCTKTKCTPMKATCDAPGSRNWSSVEGVPELFRGAVCCPHVLISLTSGCYQQKDPGIL